MSNFKPGDKVWIENHGGYFPAGTYAGVVLGPDWTGWWKVDIEGIVEKTVAHEIAMRHRGDDPPEQTPREATGEWELCPWRPKTVAKENA